MRILLVLAFAVAVVGSARAEERQLSWQVDGVERRALVFVPASPVRNVPVVFAFHGAGDTARGFSAVGFQREWPDALIVYMEGLGRVPGGGGAFQTTDASIRNRDLRFFDVALAALKQQFRIDDSRIYATGFSNGAKFVYLLWAERPAVFAALAPVAGMLTAPTTVDVPKPLLHIGGRGDHQNEFSEQLESVELGRRVNGAMGSGTACGRYCTVYAGTGARVVTVLHDGGHVYPGDAAALIVRFFRDRF